MSVYDEMERNCRPVGFLRLANYAGHLSWRLGFYRMGRLRGDFSGAVGRRTVDGISQRAGLHQVYRLTVRNGAGRRRLPRDLFWGEPMTKAKIEIEHDGFDLFVVRDGRKIAKRGRTGTPQAGTWVPLESGYSVFGDEDLKAIIIKQNGVRIH
jgi:hypothetical protein